MTTISVLTILWLLNSPPIAGVALLFYGIPLSVIALIIALIFDAISKETQLSLLVLTGAVAVFGSMFFIIPLLAVVVEYLPTTPKDTYIITLDVDTPTGPLRASGDYQVRTNEYKPTRKLGGRTFLQGNAFTLELGKGMSVEVDVPSSWKECHPRNVYGYAAYANGNTNYRKEIPVEFFPALIGTNGDTRTEVAPEDFEEFFGEGIRFRRLWMQVTNSQAPKPSKAHNSKPSQSQESLPLDIQEEPMREFPQPSEPTKNQISTPTSLPAAPPISKDPDEILFIDPEPAQDPPEG